VKLALFDIDGTLVNSGGQGRPAFEAALVEVFGTAGAIDSYDFSGKLDGKIAVDLAESAGISEAEARAALPHVRTAYLERFAKSFDPARAQVLPGVAALLASLAARDDLRLGLLTGNWREGARIKLGRLGLFEFFPFGGFGDDALDRRELPPIALERARSYVDYPFSADETVIVGDSLLDVDCARANGIPCLAVATGWTTGAALAGAGAQWVLASLERAADHPAFVTARR
jgi:phosphoglycolate phosphatase